MAGDRVLITGANGFIARHCIAAALARGYRVRGTVRRPETAAELNALMKRLGGSPDTFEIVTADLLEDAGWEAAAAGCRFVLHTASPFPLRQPKRPEALLGPARQGTIRVLGAAAAAGVERTVVTSSTAAILYGRQAAAGHVYTEADWSEPQGISTYSQSKTLAERAAWEFSATDRSGMSLSVVNPGATLGPALGGHISTSGRLVSTLLSGRLPILPPMSFVIVDVRDVAEAHLRAMETPAAGGERILAVSETLSMSDIAAILAKAYPARRIPQRVMSPALFRVLGGLVPQLRGRLREIGIFRVASNAKARNLLGLEFRSGAEAVLAMAESVLRPGKA